MAGRIPRIWEAVLSLLKAHAGCSDPLPGYRGTTTVHDRMRHDKPNPFTMLEAKRRHPAWMPCAAVILGSVIMATPAMADTMDPALARLVLDERCRTGNASGNVGKYYNPLTGFARCPTNDAAFAKLIAQMGFAIAPTASHAARTTGFGGYKVSFEAAYTTIDSDAHYWKEGTQGAVDESTGGSSIRNPSPDSLLQMYTLKLSKGFPFGVELGAGFGHLANTTIVAGGGDVRIALFEGFRTSVPGFLPDVGVGGGVRTITGTPEVKLTVASFDAQVSKPIPIAGSVILTPHVGYQWLRIFGDSGLVDLTPNTDAVQQCGYQGDNSPASPDPAKAPNFDGQPTCTGSSADFNNNVVFDAVRLTRHRLNFGAHLRYQMMHFGIHAITEVVPIAEANQEKVEVLDPSDPSNKSTLTINYFEDDPRTEGDDAVKTQWTIALELGAVF